MKRRKMIEQIKSRLAFLRSGKTYGSNPFVLGETNSLLWVLSLMGETDA
jgi:hypothetical protein